MIELAKLMAFEYVRIYQFSESSFENVTKLLTIINENTEVGEKIPAEVKITLSIAALRAKIPAIEGGRVAEKWEGIFSSEETQELLKVYAPLERPLKEKIEQSSSAFRGKVDFLEELSQQLAEFAANVSRAEKWHGKAHQKVLDLLMKIH